MILVTTGTQLPFDRMVQTVDSWAKHSDVEVYGQIGSGDYRPENFEFCDFLTPLEYSDAFDRASVLVAHAGMGSIITAMEKEIPVIIMPRQFSLGEHRNDHQLSTAKRFDGSPGVYVAWDESNLLRLLDRCQSLNATTGSECESRYKLIHYISDFLN